MKNHELAIQDLVARYCDALVRDDAGAWESTWAGDATWDLAGLVVEGREAIVNLWRQATAPFSCIVQVSLNPMIRVHDDASTAHGRWTIVEYLNMSDGTTSMQNIGIYDDDYSLVEGEWLFAKRRFQPLLSGPGLTPPPSGHSVISKLR